MGPISCSSSPAILQLPTASSLAPINLTPVAVPGDEHREYAAQEARMADEARRNGSAQAPEKTITVLEHGTPVQRTYRLALTDSKNPQAGHQLLEASGSGTKPATDVSLLYYQDGKLYKHTANGVQALGKLGIDCEGNQSEDLSGPFITASATLYNEQGQLIGRYHGSELRLVERNERCLIVNLPPPGAVRELQQTSGFTGVSNSQGGYSMKQSNGFDVSWTSSESKSPGALSSWSEQEINALAPQADGYRYSPRGDLRFKRNEANTQWLPEFRFFCPTNSYLTQGSERVVYNASVWKAYGSDLTLPLAPSGAPQTATRTTHPPVEEQWSKGIVALRKGMAEWQRVAGESSQTGIQEIEAAILSFESADETARAAHYQTLTTAINNANASIQRLNLESRSLTTQADVLQLRQTKNADGSITFSGRLKSHFSNNCEIQIGGRSYNFIGNGRIIPSNGNSQGSMDIAFALGIDGSGDPDYQGGRTFTFTLGAGQGVPSFNIWKNVERRVIREQFVQGCNGGLFLQGILQTVCSSEATLHSLPSITASENVSMLPKPAWQAPQAAIVERQFTLPQSFYPSYVQDFGGTRGIKKPSDNKIEKERHIEISPGNMLAFRPENEERFSFEFKSADHSTVKIIVDKSAGRGKIWAAPSQQDPAELAEARLKEVLGKPLADAKTQGDKLVKELREMIGDGFTVQGGATNDKRLKFLKEESARGSECFEIDIDGHAGFKKLRIFRHSDHKGTDWTYNVSGIPAAGRAIPVPLASVDFFPNNPDKQTYGGQVYTVFEMLKKAN